MRNRTLSPLATLVFAATALSSCGGGSGGPLSDVDALVILQRTPRVGMVGDVFQYSSYLAGAKLTKLSPPSADGKRTNLCCDAWPEFADVDIQAFDVAYDARSIVFSGRLGAGERYGLFVLTLNEDGEPAGPPAQLATDPMHDYVYPVFAPGGRIVFVTNEVVEPGAEQHRDEYERGETTQLGSISVDGTDLDLGPRNLSHRVAPTMLSDGRVLFTNWDHLGDENAGHLMITNPDFTSLREAFGKEGSGPTNSYLKAIEVEPGRLVAIGTSRDRTFQAGKVLDIRLGEEQDGIFRQSEARASYTDRTPDVPGGREPSYPTVGRYHDVYPVPGKAGATPPLLVSWADGPVEQETLGAADLSPDFGVYVLEGERRRPVFNDPDMWDVSPRPLVARDAPPVISPSTSDAMAGDSFLIGALDVTNSSVATIGDGEAVTVRVLEGFSVEEGVPDDFGMSRHEGAAMLGEVDVAADGSFAALVPANVPIHLQAVDRFGMAIVNEPVWFSGRAGEARVCGGCHEDRAATTIVPPGVSEALAEGATDLDLPRAERTSTTYTRDAVVGVPWDLALQPVFDQKCAGCHDGNPNKPGNATITVTDPMSMMSQTFVFDLTGAPGSYYEDGMLMSGYSKSHQSLLLGELLRMASEDDLEVEGEVTPWVVPGNARESALFDKLNPPQLYPYDPSVRLHPGQPVHPVDVGGTELTEDEYYLLILMTDAGGQFYSRENAPGGGY